MPNVITGSDLADSPQGTAGDDQISTFGGNDWIELSSGHDTIDGGAGDDIVSAFLSGSPFDLQLPAGPHSYVVTDSHVGDVSGTLDTSMVGVEQVQLSDLSSDHVTFDGSDALHTRLLISTYGGTHTLVGGHADD